MNPRNAALKRVIFPWLMIGPAVLFAFVIVTG